MTKNNPPPSIVGIAPWLPWPLSAWSWWTVPVRAERLAVLRIGVALCLLFDIAYNYAPATLDFFSKNGIGDPTIFNWRFDAPRANWSLLRGVGDHATLHLALAICIALAGWILFNSASRLVLGPEKSPPDDRTGFALPLWTCSFTVYILGQWAAMLPNKLDYAAWLLPLIGCTVLTAMHMLDYANRLRDPNYRLRPAMMLTSVLVCGALAAFGHWLSAGDPIDKSADWLKLLRSWQNDPGLTMFAMWLWLLSAVLLLLGILSRFAAIAAWMLSMSFAAANPYLDNAGDTIRLILQFYLMLSPCGAAWSVDALIHRRAAPVYVQPWPLRMIFVQMVYIYFMNGLYKVFGESWLQGYSLYYVLGDATLTRFSQAAFPIPLFLTRIMTWTVLAWEVAFPVLLITKWTRIAAFVMGVVFHLGIFATMELGGFVPYALCMYLPLLPWEKLCQDATPHPEARE